MSSVHVAVTRVVKPGCEAAFEAGLIRFIRETMDFPGVNGVHLIKPGTDGANPEYGILRSFESRVAMERFYASDSFAAWQRESAPLTEGDYRRRPLHGLEAFFRGTIHRPPPRWRMALVTWLGVFPMVVLWGRLLGGRLGSLPPLLATALVTLCVTASLAWVVMPLLTTIFRTWLIERE